MTETEREIKQLKYKIAMLQLAIESVTYENEGKMFMKLAQHKEVPVVVYSALKYKPGVLSSSRISEDTLKS